MRFVDIKGKFRDLRPIFLASSLMTVTYIFSSVANLQFLYSVKMQNLSTFQVDSRLGSGGQILTRRRSRFDFL